MKHNGLLAVVCLQMSPPARGRGLKPPPKIEFLIKLVSPPARGRGLKLEVGGQNVAVLSRPPRGGVD